VAAGFRRGTALAEFTQNFGDDQPTAIASMLKLAAELGRGCGIS